MEKIFAVNCKNGRLVIDPDAIKAIIIASIKKKEEKKGFRVLTKRK